VDCRQTFEDLLRVKVPDFKTATVHRCRRRLGSLVFQALQERSSELAQEAYDEALVLPHTETEHILSIDGFTLNGQWTNGNPNFIMSYKESVVYLLKVLNEREALSGLDLQIKLRTTGEQNKFLVPFEIRRIESSRRISNVMIMPLYGSSLEPCPRLGIATGQKLFSQIASALHTIHACELQHMDIKPANICMRDNGDFVLIDLGSVISLGSYSLSTTVYLPRDYQVHRSAPNRYQATEVHDWLMLGMTIAEKVYSVPVGTAKPSPTFDELISILRTDDAFDELILCMSAK
jgi:serine/threonine protein kinase